MHTPVNLPNTRFPLLLNTGRVRDHWHTMTRTALSPRLNQHTDEPFLAVHPEDAKRFQLPDQSLCKVSSKFGSAVVRVHATNKQRVGEVFMPMHWSRQLSKTGLSGPLVNPVVDTISKQPDLKFTPISVTPYPVEHSGILFCREKAFIFENAEFSGFQYLTEVRSEHCFRYEVVGELPVINGYQGIEYVDDGLGEYRKAWFAGCRLQAIWLSGQANPHCDRQWLQSVFATTITTDEASKLLAGIPPLGEDTGKLVCACFGIGEKTIGRAIAENDINSPEQAGEILKAGTNSGSCIPEIRAIINH